MRRSLDLLARDLETIALRVAAAGLARAASDVRKVAVEMRRLMGLVEAWESKNPERPIVVAAQAGRRSA